MKKSACKMQTLRLSFGGILSGLGFGSFKFSHLVYKTVQ